MKTHPEIRQPAVAGLFYPAGQKRLKSTLQSLLEGVTADHPLEKPILGMVAPHAGYRYSGAIAAAVYKQLEQREYATVLVIAPSHFDAFPGCSVYLGDYQTPLGRITTDRDLAEALVAHSSVVQASTAGHRREHSLEVQLPFLQMVLPEFKLVPLVMGEQDQATSAALAETVSAVLQEAPFCDRSVLVIASSDLSHFYPVETAKELDGQVVEDIGAFDEQQLQRDIAERRCQACGSGAIVATMMIAKKMGATHSKVLAYGTSGDVNRNYREVVGYLSAVFYGSN